jgi:hypothetical protein
VETYIGDWKDDKRHGEGKSFYSNGNKYEGEYKVDKMEGYGVYEL